MGVTTPIGLLAAAAAAMAPVPQQYADPASPSLAVSRAPLPRFPYLRWPAAYGPQQPPVEQAVGHFRFWDGKALQDVEGRTWLATLVRHGGFRGEVFGQAIEADLTRLGGIRIAAGRVPAALVDTINDADKQALRPGLGDVANSNVQTWIIRRANRQIWVQVGIEADRAAIAVVALAATVAVATATAGATIAAGAARTTAARN